MFAPVYYPLEAITNQDACQNLYQNSDDETTDQAVDNRYDGTIGSLELPN